MRKWFLALILWGMFHPLFALENKNYFLGKYEPALDKRFIRADKSYTQSRSIYLRKEAYKAFLEMADAAKKDGIKLVILSGTRTFKQQKAIWESKWTGQTLVEGKDLARDVKDPLERARTILRFSSMPGSSRHHWGSDIDLNNLNNVYFESGAGIKLYNWLKANAPRFGFGQPYGPLGTQRPAGYQEEKWHWSYLPISRQMLSEYDSVIGYPDIKGFKGAEQAEPLRIIQDYVHGVDQTCR